LTDDFTLGAEGGQEVSTKYVMGVGGFALESVVEAVDTQLGVGQKKVCQAGVGPNSDFRPHISGCRFLQDSQFAHVSVSVHSSHVLGVGIPEGGGLWS
jgi:hypothetical protein